MRIFGEEFVPICRQKYKCNTAYFATLLCYPLPKKIALHYHWLEFQDLKSLLAFPYKLLWFSIFTLFKTPIIWTVHNLEPHDRKWLSFHQWLHRKMAQKTYRLHIHDEALLSETSHYLNVPLHSKNGA